MASDLFFLLNVLVLVLRLTLELWECYDTNKWWKEWDRLQPQQVRMFAEIPNETLGIQNAVIRGGFGGQINRNLGRRNRNLEVCRRSEPV